MKNIIITSVAAMAVLAFVGCAPKASCQKNEIKKPVEKVVAPTPAPVVKAPAPAPAPVVVEKAEPVKVPVMDAKEAAVQ